MTTNISTNINTNSHLSPRPYSSPFPRDSSWCTFFPAQACQRGGAWEEAVHLAEIMLEHRVPRDTITYNALIRACEGAGQWQAAFDFMKEMNKIR